MIAFINSSKLLIMCEVFYSKNFKNETLIAVVEDYFNYLLDCFVHDLVYGFHLLLRTLGVRELTLPRLFLLMSFFNLFFFSIAKLFFSKNINQFWFIPLVVGSEKFCQGTSWR